MQTIWIAAACITALSTQTAISDDSELIGVGCNEDLLRTDFSLENAPQFEADAARVTLVGRVIQEMKNGYGGTMVLTPSNHSELDTPKFVSRYLREFAAPEGDDFSSYDYRFERLFARISGHMVMLEDSRLDWDIWRSWLLFENTASTGTHYEVQNPSGESSYAILDGARTLLWNYLLHNASAILSDKKRFEWWISQLTRDLESPGHSERRWFLLALLQAADAAREELYDVPMAEKFSPYPSRGQKVRLRQPHPLDPFLLVEEEMGIAPPFADCLVVMATEQGLSLELLGIRPEEQPETTIQTVFLELTKWTILESRVINQESWSSPDHEDRASRIEWSVRNIRPIGQRAGFSSVSLPEDRDDGVFFFVFNRRLCVWPKAEMDRAVIHMLRVSGLISEKEFPPIVGTIWEPLDSVVLKE